jgi:hypothetical protein
MYLLEEQQADIIKLLLLDPKFTDICNHCLFDVLCRLLPILTPDRAEWLQSILGPAHVHCFYNAIGVEDNAIAWMQIEIALALDEIDDIFIQGNGHS